MAGDWIKMRTNLDTDPAVVRIASGLKTDRYSVVGRLHRIWSWANEHLTDGQDVPVDSEFLDALVETPGFSEQLRRVGWLSGRDGSLVFPSFERHNGASAKSRAMDSERKKSVRKMSGSQPDKFGTREEKRREEKSNTNKQTCEEIKSPLLEDGEFSEIFEAFLASSRVNHNWRIAGATAEAWLYELQNLGLDGAKAAVRFSTAAGAKKPITNGDHSRPKFKNESGKPKMKIIGEDYRD